MNNFRSLVIVIAVAASFSLLSFTPAHAQAGPAAGGAVTSVTGSGAVSCSPTTGAVTCSGTGSGSGTVTEVDTAGGLCGGPITTTGTVETCVNDVTKAASYQIAAGNMAGQVNYNGSSLTATIPAISSTVFANGMSALLTNFASTALTVTSTPTINGCPWSDIYDGGFFNLVSNGTSLDCAGFPGFGAVSGDVTITAAGVSTVGKIGGTAIALGTLADGKTCTYASSGTAIICNTTPVTAVGGLAAVAADTVLGNPTGSSAAPSATIAPVLGVQQTSQGSITLANTAAGAYSTKIQSSNSATAGYTLVLPTTAGTNGYSLTTNGSGVLAWSNVSSSGCTVSGSQYQILAVDATGAACNPDANASVNAGVLTLGASGTAGSVVMGNASTGTVTLQPVTGALGSVTASLPANSGTIAELNLAQTFSAAQSFGEVHGTAYAPTLTSNNYNAAIADCGNTLLLPTGTTPTVTLPNVNPSTRECTIKMVQMTSGTSLYTIQAASGGTLVSANGYTHTAKQYATIVLTLIVPSGSAATWALSGEGS